MADSAQRDLEQEALRNVRNLVDKIESEDRKGNQKQVVAVIVIVAIVTILAAVILVGRSKNVDTSKSPAIEIPPPKLPAKP